MLLTDGGGRARGRGVSEARAAARPASGFQQLPLRPRESGQKVYLRPEPLPGRRGLKGGVRAPAAARGGALGPGAEAVLPAGV